MITKTATNNGYILSCSKTGLTANIDNAERFISVLDIAGNHYGLLIRPLVIDQHGQWEGHNNAKTVSKRFIGPRAAFAAIVQDAIKACAANRANGAV